MCGDVNTMPSFGIRIPHSLLTLHGIPEEGTCQTGGLWNCGRATLLQIALKFYEYLRFRNISNPWEKPSGLYQIRGKVNGQYLGFNAGISSIPQGRMNSLKKVDINHLAMFVAHSIGDFY